MNLSKFAFSVFKIRLLAIVCGIALCVSSAMAAGVIQRGSAAASAAAAGRASISRTMPVAVVTTATHVAAEPAPVAVVEPVAPTNPEPAVIENKSSQFDRALGSTGNNSVDTGGEALAAAIRAQRAAFDSASATAEATRQTAAATAAGSASTCNTGLRDCMRQTCGNDFLKCAGDGDTIWGDKMNRCRRDLSCTGHEFQMYSVEIKADRDMNQKMESYQEVLDCGNRYNSCLIDKCGDTLEKCLGKTAGDKAVADCASVARSCQSMDSGLANRAMQVFGTLRQGAEAQVQKDEQRLYQLRDLMSAQCARLGAMFDERTLDCVFTVNFFADDSAAPFASKKLYAGDSFDCTQNWFGVDITTYRENAQRLTREQTSASSAMLGSGLGIAAGTISSGAINRAIDRASAERAVKTAEKEHQEDSDSTDTNADVHAEDKDHPKKEEDKNSQQKATEPSAESQKKSPLTESEAKLEQEFKKLCGNSNGSIDAKIHEQQDRYDGYHIYCTFSDLNNSESEGTDTSLLKERKTHEKCEEMKQNMKTTLETLRKDDRNRISTIGRTNQGAPTERGCYIYIKRNP
jgi:hypothetical protein